MHSRDRLRALISRLGPWAFLLAYFFWFAGAGLWAPFTGDDLMNLNSHLTPSFGHLLLGNLMYWTNMYRPIGGLVYASTYHLMGFDPLPFRVLCFGLLIGNLVLVYRVTHRLSESTQVALLATLLLAYHAWFIDLYYSTGTVYELLCFAFYFGAFCFYIEIRSKGALLTTGQCLGFLALYIGALDAKELAVSLPLSIGCYELIWHGPKLSLHACKKWLVREGRVTVFAGLVTLPYVIGRLAGPESLAANPLYRPSISPARYLHALNLYLDVLFYQDHFFRPFKTILLLAIMLGLAIWKRSCPLLFAWVFVLFSVLPFIFISHYSGFFMYLPSAGWALYGATALGTVRPLRPKPVYGAIAFLGIAFSLAPLHARMTRKTLAIFESARLPTREMTAELRRAAPKPPTSAHVYFVDDPFPPHSYWLLFLVRLVYNDLTIQVTRARDGDLPDGREYDMILRWDHGRLLKQ